MAATLAQRIAQLPLDPHHAQVRALCESMVGATIATEVRMKVPGRPDPVVISTLDSNVVGHHVERLVGAMAMAGQLLTPGPPQQFPDYRSASNHAYEVKVYGGRTPGFDVGQFGAVAAKYATSAAGAGDHLTATYLIFNYSIDADGGLARIESFRALPVWGVVGLGSVSTGRELTVQAKRGQWFALRPRCGTALNASASETGPDDWVRRLCSMARASPAHGIDANARTADAIARNCADI
jgi:hypothetical protein